MSLSGGLIQLISKNNEDRILTDEPEIFPFLKIYKKYTNFSIDEVDKNIGFFKKGNEFSIKLNNTGDLLGNMNFIIKIPKKQEEKIIKTVIESFTTKETLSLELFNTVYNINKGIKKIDEMTLTNILILTDENYNNAYSEEYESMLFQINLDEGNLIINNILSYQEVYIYLHKDIIINELFKFNNIREKFYISLGSTNSKTLSVLSEHFKEYFNILKNLFITNYDFTYNKNLKNTLYTLDDSVALTYYENKLDSNYLKYVGHVILDNFMSHLKYNNQRFYIDFQYNYNKESDIFLLSENNILNIIEFSNNQTLNLNEIINTDFSSTILQSFVNNYYNIESYIKTNYQNPNLNEQLLLINFLNYRDILNNNFIKKEDVDLSLDINLQTNFETDYINSYFKRSLLTLKVNLIYKVLNLFDLFLNELSKITLNHYPLIIFKRILCCYFFIRDQYLENNNFRNINNIKNININDVETDGNINSVFFIGIDRMYPLKKDFFYNEINKLKYITNQKIYHQKINDNKLIQQTSRMIVVKESDNNNFTYMISNEQLNFKFLSKYSFKLNNKQLISYVLNKNIYFITDIILDLSINHELTITSTTDFLNINDMLSYNFITNDTHASLPENIIKDINICRKFNIKDNITNCFSNNDTFNFIYKRLHCSYLDGILNGTIEEININIFDYFNIILNVTKYNNKELNININKNMISVNGDNYTIIGFSNLEYSQINLIMVMKPNINIVIDLTINETINSLYSNNSLHTFIASDTLIEAYINYLLVYYNFNEIEMMKDAYENIDDSFTNEHFETNDGSNYILKLAEYIKLKYLTLNHIEFQEIDGNLNFLNETYLYLDISTGITTNYYVIPKLLSNVLITNTFYYDNLLKLTSLSSIITNSYYTDFLTYHPLIINLDDNNSILVNTTDFDLFEINSIGSESIIKLNSITSTSLFKEYNNNTVHTVSMTLLDELPFENLFDEIFQDNIMEMINNIEINVDISYLNNFKKILDGEFDDYTKKILNYIIENNVHNNLFNSNSNINQTSIYKFYQKGTNGEVTDIIGYYPLMELVNNNMPNDFFNNRKLDSNDFYNLRKLGDYLIDKFNYIEENYSKINILDSNYIINSIIFKNDKLNKLENIAINDTKEENIYLSPLLFKSEYINSITNPDTFQSYSEHSNENILKEHTSIFCNIENGYISDFETPIYSIEDGYVKPDPMYNNIVYNMEILNDDNIVIKEGLVLNPKIVYTEEINDNLKNYQGYIYSLNVDNLDESFDILNKYCIIHNGEKYHYVFIFKVDYTDNIVTLISQNCFNMFKMIQIVSLISGDIDTLNLDWNDDISSTNEFTKWIVELTRIYEFNNLYIVEENKNVLDSLLIYPSESNNILYYFCKNENPLKFTVIYMEGPPVIVNGDKYYNTTVDLQDNMIYRIRDREIYFTKLEQILNESNEPLNGNYIIEGLHTINMNIIITPGDDIYEQTNLKFVDDLLILDGQTLIRLNENYLFQEQSNIINAWKIIRYHDRNIYNYSYEIDVLNSIEDNSIKFNNYNYNYFENGIIQKRDYIKLFYKYITRTIRIANNSISNAYKYVSFVFDSVTTAYYPTSILNFNNINETIKIIIKDSNNNKISFSNNFKLDSKFIKYTIESKTGTDDSNYDELVLKLNEDYTFKLNIEYVVLLNINNEEVLLNIYYNSTDIIYLNLTSNDLTKTTKYEDNINRPLTFENIKDNYSTLNNEKVYLFNFPFIKNTLLITDNFKFEEVDPSSSYIITTPIINITNPVYIKNPGYITNENNELYMYSINEMVEGMKIKIDSLTFIIKKTFGKISLLNSNDDVNNISIANRILSFDGYLYYGLEYIYFNDDELNNFKMGENSSNNQVVLPLFYYIKDKFNLDLFTYVSNGLYDTDYTLAYKVLNSIHTGDFTLLNLNFFIPNLNKFPVFLLLNEHRQFIGSSEVIYTNSDNIYKISKTMNVKYILINGDNIKFNKLKINNDFININTCNLEHDKMSSLTLGVYDIINKYFLINRYVINYNKKTEYIINSQIFNKILDNLDNKIIILLNDKNKISLSVNEESLKEHLQILYLQNQYLFNDINSDITLEEYLENDINTLLSDLKKISENIDISHFEIKLTLNLKYKKSNLNFIKEIYDNKSLIHFIKIRGNIIISNIKIEDDNNTLLLNGIYKIKIINNKIIYQKNKYNKSKFINNGLFNLITYKIPIITISSKFLDEKFIYTIKILNSIFNDELNNPTIEDNLLFLDEGLTQDITNKVILNTEFSEEGYNYYDLELENNFQVRFIYVQVNNQIINKKKSYDKNFIVDNLRNKIYYTSRIDNIQRVIDNEYDVSTDYTNLFNSNLDKSFILINNTTNSITFKNNVVKIKTNMNIDNITEKNSNNLFYDSTNSEIINNSNEYLDPYFLYDRNSNYLELYYDFSDKNLYNALNNPSSQLIEFNNSLFTKKQYDLIKDIDVNMYNQFHTIAVYIVEIFIEDYYNMVLFNIIKGINDIEDLDFNISYHLKKIYQSDTITYTREQGIIIEGYPNYNNIDLSIKVDENSNIIQDYKDDKRKLFTFKEFIDKLADFLELAKTSKKEIYTYIKNNKINDYDFLKVIKQIQYSKYCIDKNYNPDYIESENNNIFKYNLELKIIEDSYELFINNNNINYEYFDDKNITFYYNQPDIFINSLTFEKKYNIINSELLGSGYIMNVNIILSDGLEENFSLVENMKLITILDSQIIELIVKFVNNTQIIYSNFDLSILDNINVFQDIYIYKKEEIDGFIKYTFNIENVKLNNNNLYLLIDMINYKIQVNFIDNTILIPNTNVKLLEKLEINKYYYITNFLKIKDILKSDTFLKVIEIDDDFEINILNESYFLNEKIVIDKIKKVSSNKFEIISTSNEPLILIRDIVEKVNDSIIYNHFEIQDDKVYIINTINHYITLNSSIIINNKKHIIFKINNDLLFTTDIDNFENIVILNNYTLSLDSNGNYVNNNIYFDLVNEDSDYNISYYYYVDDNIVYISLENMRGNGFKIDDINDNMIEIYQTISFNNNIFIPYQFHKILKLNIDQDAINLIPDLSGYIQNNSGRIYEISLKLDVITEYKTTFNINNIITEVIIIQKSYKNYYIKVNSLVEVDGMTYFISDENLIDGLFNNIPIFEIKINNNFIIRSVSASEVILFVDTKTIIPTVNYLFITKNYLTITNKTYGDISLLYQDKNILVEEKKIKTDILPNKFELFSYLKLFIDNNKIDHIEPDIYKTMYNYHFNDQKKKQFDEITKPRDIGDYYKITLPLMFYFYDNPHMFLPIIALTNSEIRLFGKVNFDCKLELINQFILLDNFERYKFGSYGHEYLIESYHNYGNFYQDKIVNINNLHINGMVKDIYIKTIDRHGNNVETLKELVYDNIYLRFMEDKSKTTTVYKRIIDELELYLNDDSNNLFVLLKKIYQIFKTKSSIKEIISYELILYILYNATNYLSNTENLDVCLFKTIIIINTIEIKENIIKKPYINTLNFKCNGDSLFNKHDELYFNSVTPYKKLNSSLPDGYYFMTFSIEPEEKNPSGHLNFNLFEENVLITNCNDNITNNNVQINVITKEYNILRIIGGMGCLSWPKI